MGPQLPLGDAGCCGASSHGSGVGGAWIQVPDLTPIKVSHMLGVQEIFGFDSPLPGAQPTEKGKGEDSPPGDGRRGDAG